MEDRTQVYIDWVNSLFSSNKEDITINSLDDLSDGTIFIQIVEKLTHQRVRNAILSPENRKQKIQNIESSLELAQKKFGELHGVEVEPIVDGDPLLTCAYLEAIKTSSEAEVKRTKVMMRNTIVKREMIQKQSAKISTNTNFTFKTSNTSTQTNSKMGDMRISIAKRPSGMKGPPKKHVVPQSPLGLASSASGALMVEKSVPNLNTSNLPPVAPERPKTPKAKAEMKDIDLNKPPTLPSPRKSHKVGISFHDLSRDSVNAPPVPKRSYKHRKDRLEREVREFTSSEMEEVVVVDVQKENSEVVKTEDIKRINDKVFQVNGKLWEVKEAQGDENVMVELNLAPKVLKEFVVACARQILTEFTYSEQLEKEDNVIEDLHNSMKDDFLNQTIIKIQSYVRGHNVRRFPEVQGMAIRKFTMKEITSSEELYVSNLILLKDFYLQKLVEYKDEELIKNTMKDLEMIIKYNQTLLNALLSFKQANNIYGNGFAKQFYQFTMFLKSYTTYINHQSLVSDDIFQKSQKNKNYGNKLKELSMQPEVKNQTVFSYLILPVQRIPRYELFIKQLIKNIPSYHKERQDLSRSLKAVSDINKHLNETRRINENIQRVQFIASKLITKKFDLADDKYRRYIQGGFVKLQGHPQKFSLHDLTERPHCILLFSDVILLIPATKPQKVGDENQVDTLLNSGKFKCKDIIPIYTTSMIDFGGNRCFFINKESTYLIAFETADEKKRWMNLEDDCLVNKYASLVSKGAELRKQTGMSCELTNAVNFDEKIKLFSKPDFESEAYYRDNQTGMWNICYLVLIGSIIYVFDNAISLVNKAPPIKQVDVTNFSLKSPVISTKPSSFEISFRYEEHTFAAKDDEAKTLWMVALRIAFVKFNVWSAMSKTETLPQLIMKEPLPFLIDEMRVNEVTTFLNNMLLVPENRICADCLFREVSTVDLDYGVFICGPCSRSHIKLQHRTLKKGGVPVLLFKQVIDFPLKVLSKLQTLGNLRGNAYFLKSIPENQIPAKEELQKYTASSMAQWIMKKYSFLPADEIVY
ncbi:Rho/RAC guanine nucleotide exchange factor, putative [Entamoeba invadens IP1]|uniref:Rho/RAC guanine nucleotide exchange factor, putative n=1 Tax=Entamoeba invadens IP1 TaxID=370355 RepID=A0A0A1TXJ4_ENTIV|nr:Rho/RAC guanine nucleotide exchange factor, putative [Entamoeba invadens IP1]ELP84240.1 Rho/RAC guanine nucleotide exchange factor, putative [Entamoeba invadens IP1]|eukprot:XP_004183586.1 Rho/RAC guanine nucleotide exchange factor, putative [Entamoeba invadens IP1]